MSTTSKKKTAAKKTAKKTVSKKKAAKKTATKKVTKKVTKKAAKKSSKPDISMIDISPEERWKMIAVAAYHKAEKRNFAPGNDLHDWTEAEREIDALLYG